MDSIKLTHPFVNKCPDIDALLKKDDGTVISSIESFCARIKKQAVIHWSKFGIDEDRGSANYKGDVLELFTEFMIKTDGADHRIGIFDYRLVTDDDEEDKGVDGHGIGSNGNPATVQVKYRRGDYVLTANNDHLSNFLTSSWIDYAVPTDDDQNMLIVTTGMKVDEQSREKMLKNKVRVLNRDALRAMYDNRQEWWERFYDAVKDSRIKEIKPNVIQLREHQKEAVDLAIKEHNRKGMIILPTGTGKTLIEADIIYQEILTCKAKGILPVIKVNSSRILLCFQLFEEIFNYLNSYGIESRYINFNSGNADEKAYAAELRKMGGVFRQIVSTTSFKQVIEVHKKAIQENVPLIVFSTYHSSEKFSKSEIVPNLVIHDEAHNLVSPEFGRVANLPSGGDYYFTATMKVTESEIGLGMNNREIFDNIIYQQSAKRMIEKGEMVQPRIHILKASNQAEIDITKTETDYDALFRSIISAFDAHSTQITKDSYDATQIGAKILVVCRGQQDLIEMFKTKTYEEYRESNPEVNLFALSSDFGLRFNDEYFKPPVTNMKKHKLLKTLKALKPNEKCIVFHVDMIGEGIDVPGITGVMPFRNCELSKFVQNIGRSARLHPYDRHRFYKGEINPSQTEKYVKPYSWVIIPNFLANSNEFADRFNRIIQDLRSNYGITPETVLITNERGLSDDEPIDADNAIAKKKKHTDSGINGFDHEFENMTALERMLVDQAVSIKKESTFNELNALINSGDPEIAKEIIVEKDENTEKVQKPIAEKPVNKNSALTQVPRKMDKRLEVVGKKLNRRVFSLKHKSLKARLRTIKNGYVLEKGSQVSENTVKSCIPGVIKKREKLIKDGKIVNWVVVEDIMFKSPSGAASVVCGYGINGWMAWESDKTPLKNYLTD